MRRGLVRRVQASATSARIDTGLAPGARVQSWVTPLTDVFQLDGHGRTAAQVATTFGKHDVAALLQGLGV